jgi:hypothetical protein
VDWSIPDFGWFSRTISEIIYHVSSDALLVPWNSGLLLLLVFSRGPGQLTWNSIYSFIPPLTNPVNYLKGNRSDKKVRLLIELRQNISKIFVPTGLWWADQLRRWWFSSICNPQKPKSGQMKAKSPCSRQTQPGIIPIMRSKQIPEQNSGIWYIKWHICWSTKQYKLEMPVGIWKLLILTKNSPGINAGDATLPCIQNIQAIASITRDLAMWF